jgi:uncharacterized membrane protein
VTRATRHLLRLFVTGLLAALPLAATVAVFAWAISLLLQWVGPRSAFGELLGGVGVGIIIGAILLLGLLVELGLQRGMASVVDAVVRRIPLVRNVYDLVQRFVSLLSQRDEDGAGAMQPVWVSFGGRATPGCVVLALQTTAEPVRVDGRRCLPVMVPTAPVPVGGGLMFVPEEWVVRAELSVEAVTALYVSMGVTAPQHLPAAPERGSIAP